MPARTRAGHLADAGHWLEAMTVLGDENRSHPDAELEVELVRLRHRAFAELDRTAGPETLAPVDDPFPTIHGVPPEIQSSELDPNVLRGAIQHHGSLLVRGLIPDATIDRLRNDIDRAFGARESRAPARKVRPWFTPLVDNGIDSGILEFDRAVAASKAGLLAADSPRALFDVLDVYRGIGLLDLLTEYFGEHPTLSARKTVLRKMDADTFYDALEGRGVDAGWHQDGAFLGADIRTVNLWVSLSDCGQDAPSLDLVARRVDRILPTGTEGAAYDWAVSSAVVEEVGAGAIVRPEFAPGDALFFDSFCVHQTGATPTMTRVRYAIESWFFAPSTYPLEWIPIVF